MAEKQRILIVDDDYNIAERAKAHSFLCKCYSYLF
ncbi:unknown [Clostridium sp. CAG:43]|nr:unknown [Clostridium sp. CAG:43]